MQCVTHILLIFVFVIIFQFDKNMLFQLSCNPLKTFGCPRNPRSERSKTLVEVVSDMCGYTILFLYTDKQNTSCLATTHATFPLFQTRICPRIFSVYKKNCHFMLIRAEIGEIGKKFEKKYADCR